MFPGILFIGIGILIIFLTIKGYSISNRNTFIVGGFFLFIGLMIFVGDLIDNELIIAWGIGGGVGVIFIATSIYNLYNIFKNNISIRGKVVDINDYAGGNGVKRYSPVFYYMYDGKEYNSQTYQSFSRKYVKRKCEIGQECKIYINDKTPNVVTVSKKIRLLDIVMILLGIMFILIPIGII